VTEAGSCGRLVHQGEHAIGDPDRVRGLAKMASTMARCWLYQLASVVLHVVKTYPRLVQRTRTRPVQRFHDQLA
jgi:hypothetical protein